MRHDRIELENGLEIVGEYNPDAKSVALGYFVRTGARDETPDVLGVSHFLEHMVFKGSEKRSTEAVSREFDEMGARYNAYTSDENTVYHGAVLPEQQNRLLDLYTDLIRPTLREEDFDQEKQVIMEEIARACDSPQSVLYYKARELYFGDHPLANRTLGTIESIERLRRDRMKAYHDRRYVPNNIKLVLAGSYDWDSAVARVRDRTGDWAPGAAPRDLASPEPRPVVHVERNGKFNRAHLYWICPGPSYQDPRRDAAVLAGYAIGASRGSRLYWALTEPGIADAATFAHAGDDGVGTFLGYLSCDPARTQEVADLFRQVVAEACEKGLTETEVNGAKRKLAAAHVLHDEIPMGRLMSVGTDWLYLRQRRTLDEEVDRVLALTAGDANAVLRDMARDRAVLAALGPIDRLD